MVNVVVASPSCCSFAVPLHCWSSAKDKRIQPAPDDHSAPPDALVDHVKFFDKNAGATQHPADVAIWAQVVLVDFAVLFPTLLNSKLAGNAG
mmetsp:Transcript_81893/g.158212  ORF Transcript_81893/g.158212 Transcript_81893/m.158212 type:complete len:92 (-) Transcript_81893:235-510(-)